MTYKGQLCLELGSGHRPHPAADVLVDKDLEEGHERGGAQIRTGGRPLVLADAHELPFKDLAFGWVIARHVVEHVEDPVRVGAEMARVAYGGYIETPSPIREMLEPIRSYHLWMTRVHDDTLQICRRPQMPDASYGKAFGYLWKNNLSFRLFFFLNPNVFQTQYE